MSREIDITGQKYGRLTVLYKTEDRDTAGKPYWMCKCDCGNYKKVVSANLRKGLVQSCGCYQQECRGAHIRKLGLSKTSIYRLYNNMLIRCYDKKNSHYHLYGDRGIGICDEWLNDRYKFFEWAFSHGYKEGLLIDRIDNNKGYSPENCRFVTITDSNNNRRVCHRVTFNGKEYRSFGELGKVIGVSHKTLWYWNKIGELDIRLKQLEQQCKLVV